KEREPRFCFEAGCVVWPGSEANMTSRVAIPELTRFVESCLHAVGVGASDASTAADALVTTDAMGVFTHGTKLLAGYLRKLKGGGYQSSAQPRIEREGPGWGLVHGESTLGQVGGVFAMQLAMQKARSVGIAYVGLKDSGHIGAAGYYAALAAREGFIAMVT